MRLGAPDDARAAMSNAARPRALEMFADLEVLERLAVELSRALGPSTAR